VNRKTVSRKQMQKIKINVKPEKKVIDERKQKVTMTLNKDLVSRVDAERGDITRSLFIQRMLEKKYKIKSE
jgi:transcriptional regulator CtsR